MVFSGFIQGWDKNLWSFQLIRFILFGGVREKTDVHPILLLINNHKFWILKLDTTINMYENVVKIYIYRLNIQLLILWPLLLLGGCMRFEVKYVS